MGGDYTAAFPIEAPPSVARPNGDLVACRRQEAPIDERLVQIALDQLSSRNLLDGSFKMPARLAGLNRRQLMRSLGLAGVVALPVITSLLAPTAAQAQSGCIPNGSPCSPQGQPCCSGFCFGEPATCSFGAD